MAVSNLALTEKLAIFNVFKQMRYMRNFYRNHPTYFRPDGLLIFVGPQGSGKTLSAVNYVYNLLKMYPKSKIVTNLDLKEYPVVTFEEYYDEFLLMHSDEEDDVDVYSDDYKKGVYEMYLLENRVFPFLEAKDLTRYKNGIEGVIYLIDEIQLYFNSMGYKNIDPEVMAQIAQQRKQRIHIVATSQVFGRMAKQLREQFDVVLYCEKKFFGYMQKNSLIDRNSIDGESSTGTNLKGTTKKVYRYFKNPMSFERYDTFKVIENKNLKVEREGVDIYGS